MSFSVVGSVNHLVAEYRRFLLGTYRLADPRLREQFESHIKQGSGRVRQVCLACSSSGSCPAWIYLRAVGRQVSAFSALRVMFPWT